jgi:hypothetical protein
MDQMEEVLQVLRRLKRKHNGPLPLKEIFKSLVDNCVCDSSRSVSECLKKLSGNGKIRPVNSGVDIELLEDVKIEYVQSSLAPFRK